MKLIWILIIYFSHIVISSIDCNHVNCTVIFEQTINSHTIIKANLVVPNDSYLTIGNKAMIYIEKNLILSPKSRIIFNQTDNPIVIDGEIYIDGYISTIYNLNISKIELFKFNGSNTHKFNILYDNNECKLHKQIEYSMYSIYLNINKDICNININKYLYSIIFGVIGLTIFIFLINIVIIIWIRKYIFIATDNIDNIDNIDDIDDIDESDQLIRRHSLISSDEDSYNSDDIFGVI